MSAEDQPDEELNIAEDLKEAGVIVAADGRLVVRWAES